MKLDDVKIMIGNKVYPANTVNWIQTPGDYPRIEAEALVNPFNYTAISTRYNRTSPAPLSITNVIYNPPATIVFWSDKTKTVVKCDDTLEPYDPEKGLAMAIAKKMIGNNKYEYYNVFKHWLKKWDKQQSKKQIKTIGDAFVEGEWNGGMYDAL